MTDSLQTWLKWIGRLSLTQRAVVLLMGYVVFFGFAAPLGWGLRGRVGVGAAGLAALVCLGAGWLSLMVTGVMAPPEKPAAHVLVGMAIRMGLPLAVCLWVSQQDGGLKEGGFAGYLIVAFLLGLLIETLFSVGRLSSLSR